MKKQGSAGPETIYVVIAYNARLSNWKIEGTYLTEDDAIFHANMLKEPTVIRKYNRTNQKSLTLNQRNKRLNP